MGCRGGKGAMYRRFKPHLLMVLGQFGYTFLYFITEASFKHGMNPFVYVTYRHFVGGVVMFPFAYFLEKKIRPKLTLALFLEIFVLSLLGVSLTLNMYFSSLRYTSPTFVASMVNTISSLTFMIAVLLRLEGLDGSIRGIAKIGGTLVSLTGVMVMTLYKGPVLRNLGGALIHFQGSTTIHENWIKGSILTVSSCITWALWYIMQGVVVSGLIVFIQLWCTEEKGPVFVTMFNPLATILVAVLAYFVLGEKLHTGSIIGGVIVIIGLYLLLWGKEGDHADKIKSQDLSSLSREEPKEGTQDKSIHLGGGDNLKRSLEV
ncbi:WAT1-related protein At1g44800-like isoform X4 [Magnolia sinica]|uniref:WAT1-related protein At1g44800-like isoform X4 n=1 Tax=Magnolia sinica TaxID=86752 RepID=UPI00265A86E4|nr:WAT1-related protein At1g44800-like isoform X4 [Magnolia sinica]